MKTICKPAYVLIFLYQVYYYECEIIMYYLYDWLIVSTPEPKDVKNNRSNKRQKKDNLRSDALESLELQVPPTLGEWALMYNTYIGKWTKSLCIFMENK